MRQRPSAGRLSRSPQGDTQPLRLHAGQRKYQHDRSTAQTATYARPFLPARVLQETRHSRKERHRRPHEHSLAFRRLQTCCQHRVGIGAFEPNELFSEAFDAEGATVLFAPFFHLAPQGLQGICNGILRPVQLAKQQQQAGANVFGDPKPH
eukprot:13332431-Alexandrium_andersonii.AAC.1